MDIMGLVKKQLQKRGKMGSFVLSCLRNIIYIFFSDAYITKRKFKKCFGYKLNLSNPQTLNEKIQWLKLYDRKDFYTLCADKYAVRSFLKTQFGDEYLIPLIYSTSNWKDINQQNITSFPCIIKANHTCGTNVIIKDKNSVDWQLLQQSCKKWLRTNTYLHTQEWQYKKIDRKIIVEKLLLTSQGKIPNDYKLNFINGKLEFVYVSVDREGENKRNVYDSQWKPLFFSWAGANKNPDTIRGEEVPEPSTFEKMKEVATIIAKQFKYVRVDFYVVDGRLYFGEITLHHGGGFNRFYPEEYDLIYGKHLTL
ncbi:MAG: hypothetical protein LBT27_01610 [Prevotellaceae bacterium]|jgi:hypothetical protein|nr:hypothetical protein [Prevotellaceae bacterium]